MIANHLCQPVRESQSFFNVQFDKTNLVRRMFSDWADIPIVFSNFNRNSDGLFWTLEMRSNDVGSRK
jgi:hypothetical protein